MMKRFLGALVLALALPCLALAEGEMIPLDEYGNVIEDVVEARELEFGHEGDDVSELQQRLTELGYYSGDINGKFGEKTAAAVKRKLLFHNVPYV